MTVSEARNPAAPESVRLECADAATLARELAEAIAAVLRRAIATRGHALLAVSGGKSPLALFAALREQKLDWQRVTVLLADERCVPQDHADSNAALVRAHLLQGRAAAARWVPFFDRLPAGDSTGWSDAELDVLVAAANARLAELPWPIDALVLGMGEDAHTASLFAGAPGLDAALHSHERVAWTRPPTAPHARLTLTLPTLLEATTTFLPLAGARKRTVFERACRSASAAAPISLVLHCAASPVQVWFAP